MIEERTREALERLSYGLYIVGSLDGEKRNAMTACWVSQVSFAPPLLMVAVKKGRKSCGMIEKARSFSINILKEDQQELARFFSKSIDEDSKKMERARWTKKRTGAPILEDCLAYFDCKVSDSFDAGDHTIFVGEILEASEVMEGKPLLSSKPLIYT